MNMKRAYGVCAVICALVLLSACPNPTDSGLSGGEASAFEREILAELNYARTKPAEYAQKFIKSDPSAEAAECYAEMTGAATGGRAGINYSTPLGALSFEKGLNKAAKWFVAYQGPRGEMGHDAATAGYGTHRERMNQFGTVSGWSGENCAYGYKTARIIVVELLIDKGIENRGHRDNIMKAAFTKVGIATGSHATWSPMCTMDFAQGYVSK